MAVYTFTALSSANRFYILLDADNTYTLLYTSLPIIAFGIWDQDVPKADSSSKPHLYTAGIARVHFTIPGFIYWILDGIVCANIAVWAPLLALQPEDGSLGVDGLAAVRIRQRTWHGIAATRTCLKPSAHCRPPP